MAKSQPKNSSDAMKSAEAVAKVTHFDARPVSIDQTAVRNADANMLQHVLVGKQLVSQNRQILSLQAYVNERLVMLQQRCDKQFDRLSRQVEESVSNLQLQMDRYQQQNVNELALLDQEFPAAEADGARPVPEFGFGTDKVCHQMHSHFTETGVKISVSVQSTLDEITERLNSANSDSDES